MRKFLNALKIAEGCIYNASRAHREDKAQARQYVLTGLEKLMTVLGWYIETPECFAAEHLSDCPILSHPNVRAALETCAEAVGECPALPALPQADILRCLKGCNPNCVHWLIAHVTTAYNTVKADKRV